ncbi:hypothetical protein TNCV_4033501 [Trichonephila clavipes]|nr:hypothetical protein TNCV_4033501 [Trichonephila clavipes]
MFESLLPRSLATELSQRGCLSFKSPKINDESLNIGFKGYEEILRLPGGSYTLEILIHLLFCLTLMACTSSSELPKRGRRLHVLARFHPNFDGEHTRRGQGPPTNLTRGRSVGCNLFIRTGGPHATRGLRVGHPWFRVTPCRKGTIHLQTSVPSPGFGPRPYGTAARNTSENLHLKGGKRFLKALALHFAPHHYHPEIRSCNVATPNSGRHLWWTRHPHVHLAAAEQPLFDPEESNPVDGKMRGRDALNLHGSGSQRDLVAALWDKKLAFRTRERRKFWVFTDGPQRKEKKTSSVAVLRLNSASEKESVLLKEDQTDL